MPSQPLTPDEIAWVAANPDAIRSLMAQAQDAPATASEAPPSDPVQVAASYLSRSIQERIKAIEANERKLKKRLASVEDQAAIKNQHQGTFQSWLAELRQDIEPQLARHDAHKAALVAKLQRLEIDPLALYLPIGSIVRFTDFQPNEDSLALYSDPRKSYPVAGSIGIVTALSRSGEFPMAVSLRRPFQTGDGTLFEPEYDRVPTFRVDREKVEFIDHGLLPGGVPCTAFEWVPTHDLKERSISTNKDCEMIIEADGFFWRLHDYGGTQGMEVLQAYEKLSDMTWIKGPREMC